MRRKNGDSSDIYFNLVEAVGKNPTLILNQNAQSKDRKMWLPIKQRRRETAKVYTHAGPAYGSVRNLVKASNLPVSKLKQVLHPKTSNVKFTQSKY